MAVGFASEIRPLFRPQDISAMRFVFDLSVYEDVRQNADAILARLDDGTMPCDAAWPRDQVDLFRQWILDGKQP